MTPIKITRPAFVLACFIAFQMFVLTTVPTVLSSAPPLDVVEGWTWAPHWLIGTYKHPPGPAWSIEVMHFIVPGYFLGPYLLSQISTALAYVFIYLTGRLLMDSTRALAGTLLLAGSLYFTYLGTEFNHNVLQLPFWSAIILTFAHLMKAPARTSTWIILGALVGAGMYAKYSVCVIGLVAAFAGVFFPHVRAQLRSPRPYLAVALAIVIFLPHAIWLVDNDFPPLKYVSDRTRIHGSALEPLAFLVTQIGYHAPVLALLAYVGRPAFRAAQPVETESDTKAFLRIFTFGPLALLVIGALLSGKQLIYMWGLPMFTTVGLWLVAEIGCVWQPIMVRRLGAGAVVTVILAAGVFSGERIWAISHTPKREFWPMPELAAKAQAIWSSAVQTPLEFTGGNLWLAGVVSLGLPQKPDVAVGNELGKSPWITADDISKKGMLYLAETADAPLPPYCASREPAHEIRLGNPRIPPAYATVCYPDGH